MYRNQGARIFTILLFVGGAGIANAAGPRSANYSFEYASTAAAGSVVEVGNYSLITQTTTKGLATTPCSSSRYSVDPVVGGASSPVSSVRDWSLY